MKILFCLGSLVFISNFSNSQNNIYVLSNSPNELYLVNLEDCNRTLIGNTNQQFGDIAFTEDGRLWGISAGILYEINPSTAQTDSVGLTNTNAVSLVGWNDSILLAEGNFSLYAINVNTASATYIDTIGFQAAGDLTWYDNELYMVTGFPGIIKLNFDPTFSSLLSVQAIEAPLIPSCEGAVTTSFDNDFNAIVGFSGEDAIKICRLDGSYEMLCPSVNPGGTPGAASIRLAIQNPIPSTCYQTNGLSEIESHEGYVFPNSTSSEITLKWDHLNSESSICYEVLDGLGRTIADGILMAGQGSINTSIFAAGSYFLKVSKVDGNRIFPFSVAK